MLFPKTFPVIHRLSVAKPVCVLATETDCSPLAWYPHGRREHVDRDLGGEGMNDRSVVIWWRQMDLTRRSGGISLM